MANPAKRNAVTIAGIDFSSKAVDIVLLEQGTGRAEWHRFELMGADAFDRSRSVRVCVPRGAFWDDVLAVGIEDPRGFGAGSMYRVQGAILAQVPADKLVQPWIPSAWRKAVGLPGNASKDDITLHAETRLGAPMFMLDGSGWPQDAYDAYCIALATRSLLELKEAA